MKEVNSESEKTNRRHCNVMKTVRFLHQQLHQPATDSRVNDSLDFVIWTV